MEYSSLSIIITNYNYNQYLQDAIDSCIGADEIIVVDDCSKITPKVSGYDKMIVHKENMGLSIGRNTGISSATSKRIICLDADDLLDEKYINACKKNKTNNVLYGNYTFFGDRDVVITTPKFSVNKLLYMNYIPCVLCFMKEDWEDHKYDETMKEGYEDWDFLIQLMMSGVKFAKLDVNMFYYRQHKRSMINNTITNHKGIKKYIHSKYSLKEKLSKIIFNKQ